MIHRIKSILTELGFCAKDVESVSQDIFDAYTSAERCYHNINHILKNESAKVFVQVLECAGVYKRTEAGQNAFKRFISTL